jgi:hypothetical protein
MTTINWEFVEEDNSADSRYAKKHDREVKQPIDRFPPVRRGETCETCDLVANCRERLTIPGMWVGCERPDTRDLHAFDTLSGQNRLTMLRLLDVPKEKDNAPVIEHIMKSDIRHTRHSVANFIKDEWGWPLRRATLYVDALMEKYPELQSRVKSRARAWRKKDGGKRRRVNPEKFKV